jgi:hypothetical protein
VFETCVQFRLEPGKSIANGDSIGIVTCPAIKFGANEHATVIASVGAAEVSGEPEQGLVVRVCCSSVRLISRWVVPPAQAEAFPRNSKLEEAEEKLVREGINHVFIAPWGEISFDS